MRCALLIAVLVAPQFALGMGSKPAPKPIPQPESKPQESKRIKITANIRGTVAHVARLTKILEVLEELINSEEFKAKVSSATYKDYKANGEEVLKRMSAPWDMVLIVERHCEDKYCDNLGWTYPGKKPIYFNDRGYKKTDKSKFDSREDSGLAGTICHEYCHKLGYDHKSAKSEQSVPYSVGTICANMYDRFSKR